MEAEYLEFGSFKGRMKWAGCLVWIFLLTLFGCGHDGVPVELLGEWETSASHYEDCTLTVSPETVAFRNGKSHSLLFKIDGVQVILDGWVAHYVLRYKNDAGKIYKLPLSMKKTPNGPEIQFSNQQELRWTRKHYRPKKAPTATGPPPFEKVTYDVHENGIS
jgi:hypothetical protein